MKESLPFSRRGLSFTSPAGNPSSACLQAKLAGCDLPHGEEEHGGLSKAGEYLQGVELGEDGEEFPFVFDGGACAFSVWVWGCLCVHRAMRVCDSRVCCLGGVGLGNYHLQPWRRRGVVDLGSQPRKRKSITEEFCLDSYGARKEKYHIVWTLPS